MMGVTWGAAWGVSDHSITRSDSVQKLPWFHQKLIGFLLDGTHHWWIGWIIGLYAPIPQLRWFGWGLVWDDIKDVYPRLKRFFKRWGGKTQ